MTDLEKALADIDAIRHQVARSAEFRGYGAATVAATGGLAAVVAVGQGLWLPDAARAPFAYIAVWTGAAVASVVATGVEAVTRSRRFHSGLAEEMVHNAVEQLLPALGAGLLLTAVLWQFAPEVLWILPGLWQVLFGLGIFASCSFLPRSMAAAGGWYVFTGAACLVFAQGAHAFSPWAMGLPFTLGQLLVAAVLWHHGRRIHGET